MNRHLIDALTQLYPASWRRRYAAEFSAFLEESKCGIRDVADILWSALREHLLSKGGREMNRSQHASGFLAFSFLAALAAAKPTTRFYSKPDGFRLLCRDQGE